MFWHIVLLMLQSNGLILSINMIFFSKSKGLGKNLHNLTFISSNKGFWRFFILSKMTRRFLKVLKETNFSSKGFWRFSKDASFGPNDVRYKGFAHVYTSRPGSLPTLKVPSSGHQSTTQYIIFNVVSHTLSLFLYSFIPGSIGPISCFHVFFGLM